MSDFYILDADHNPVPIKDVAEWARLTQDMGFHHRRVAVTALDGGVHVSTVFLGVDHNHAPSFGRKTAPILFETMIFGGKHDQEQWRYATWAEALAGHEVALKLAKEEFR